MRYSWLFILPIIAIIAIISYSLYRFYSKKRTVKKSVMIAHSKKIRNLPEYEKVRTRYRILLILLAIFFTTSMSAITLAASRPVSVIPVDPEYETRDIMLCIDVSGSTTSTREELLDYMSNVVNELKGQRIGITIFASKATLLSPLTNDYPTLKEIIEELRSSFYYESGNRVSYYMKAVGYSSNIGGGVVNCVRNFDQLQTEGRSQSVIIATDNIHNEGSITTEKAANYAKRYNVTLYGIDTSHRNTSANLSTESVLFKNAVTSTGGSYYSMSSSGLSVSDVVDEIFKQEAAKLASERKYLQLDSPGIVTIVAAASAILFLIVVWRIKI